MGATTSLLVSTAELMIVALVAVLDVSAQCSVFSRGYGGRPWPGGSIGVLAGEGVREADIIAAIEIWQRGCPDLYAAGRIPRLLPNRPGHRTVRVDIDAKVSPAHGVCGTFKAASITVWRFTIRDYKVWSCGPVERLIAHELGHVLALGDAPERRECCNHIMSPIWPDKLQIDRALPGECEIVAAANVPGLGLGGPATELVAAELVTEPQTLPMVISAEATTTLAAEQVTLAQEPGSRLARFLEQRRATRRGAPTSRSGP